jgi:hypothetical protein
MAYTLGNENTSTWGNSNYYIWINSNINDNYYYKVEKEIKEKKEFIKESEFLI